MRLASLLSERRILVPLPAATLEEGMRQLVQACVADGRVSDAQLLAEAISESWPEDTVTLGPHAWLPHFRTDAVPTLVVALGVAAAPLTGQGREGPAPRVILLIVAPPREAAVYLQTVAAFARALSLPEVAKGLLVSRSADDVLGLAPLREIELEGQLLVRDIMSPSVLALHPDQTLVDAVRVLLGHGVDAVPVVGESGAVVGLLSHRELLRHLVPGHVHGKMLLDPAVTQVRDVMARNVLCVPEDQSVADVAHLLATKDVEQVPVVRDGVLRGILTRSEIVRKVLGTV
ncbi:MAG: CBS domain-containing protein [Gemmatimonadales bacterium]